jgi:REP element-mobilizing transposase RayT
MHPFSTRKGPLADRVGHLPDHWHAIIHPPYPLTISTALKAVKTSSMTGINGRRREAGELWQKRFFDRSLYLGRRRAVVGGVFAV